MANKRPFRGFSYKGKNVWTEALGVKFQSKREATRWVLLNSYLQLGLISLLRRQVMYSLDVNGVHVTTYKADFVYINDQGRMVVEDSKPPSFITEEFKIKQRLMLAVHGITIELV